MLNSIVLILDISLDLPGRRRRLASVVVADLLHSLFKVQVIDADAILRVVPEFATPSLEHIVEPTWEDPAEDCH